MKLAVTALIAGAALLLPTSSGFSPARAQQAPYSGYGGYGQQPMAPAGDSTTVYGGSSNPAGGYSGPNMNAPYGASPPHTQQAAPPAGTRPTIQPAQQNQPSLVQVMQNAGRFRTFLQLADAAGFTDALNRGGPYTVFAPTDDAFARLPQGSVRNMLNNRSTAISFVRFHLLPGQIRVADLLRGGTPLRTLQGNMLEVNTRNDRATVNGAAIVEPDLVAANGIVQGIAAFALPVYPGDREGQREPVAGAAEAGGASAPLGPSLPPASTAPPSGPGTMPPAAGQQSAPAPSGPAFYR